jgi:hypothetical protein
MSLVSFFLNPQVGLPPLKLFQITNLDGWLYQQLSEGHPYRKAMRASVLARAARHALIRKHVIDLARTWNNAGLEPMIYKGFVLAEFIYQQPFERFYGDVDVLLPRESAPHASITAREAGWIEVKSLEDSPNLYRHEYSNFLSADRVCKIDFHTDVIQGHHFDVRRDKFAQAIYKAAVLTPLEDVIIRLPTPTDLLLLMLVSRRWGGRWANKPSDYPDASRIIKKFSLQREVLLQRAQELQCLKTVQLALETCDPWLDQVRLKPPSLLERWRKDFLCKEDFGLREWERFSRIPAHSSGFFRVLLPLVRAYWSRSRGGDLTKMVAGFDRQIKQKNRANYALLESVQYGMNWAMRLSPIKFNPCVPRSLALLQVLSESGFATSFVSGVRRNGAKLDGHAWLEVDGVPLEIVGDSNSPNFFKENFRYDNWLLRQRKAQAKSNML